MENYKFSVPIKVNYIVDESTLSIENLNDLEEIEEKYDVDLEFIKDEFDYKIGIDKDDEDDDYSEISDEDEIFNNIISDNWNNIIKKMNKDYKLDDLSNEDIEKIFNYTKEYFQKNISIKDFKESEYFKIDSILMNSYNKVKSEFYVNIEVDKKLNKEEIEYLRVWLDDQTVEKWGSELSNIDLSEILNIKDTYVYLYPWMSKKEIKYIK